MAQSDFPNSGSLASVLVSAEGAPPKISDGLLGHQLPRAGVAEVVLGAPRGSVIALGGIDGEGLRGYLDQVEHMAASRCSRGSRPSRRPRQ